MEAKNMTKKDMVIILENTFIEYYSACVIYSRLAHAASGQDKKEYKKLYTDYNQKLWTHTHLLTELGMEKRLPELRRAGVAKANYK